MVPPRLRQAFIEGGDDLVRFLRVFGLKRKPFLGALSRAKAIVTGVQLLHFMAGDTRRRQERGEFSPLILDVLCHELGARDVLRKMLERAGFAIHRCRHNLGEWRDVPAGKRTCLVQGRYRHRAVHLIELPRPPVETVLSRVYGSMAGTYLTCGGKVVSLFPHLTFVERRWWLPEHYGEGERRFVQDKYRGWAPLADSGMRSPEIGGEVRSVGDELCWALSFDDTTGGLVGDTSCPPAVRGGGVAGTRLSTLGKRRALGAEHLEYFRLFPVMGAARNRCGDYVDTERWRWPRERKKAGGRRGRRARLPRGK